MKNLLSNFFGFLCGISIIIAAGSDPGDVINIWWTLGFITLAVIFGYLFKKLRRESK